MRTVSHLFGFYPGICLTTEEKARKNLSQGSRRVPNKELLNRNNDNNINKYYTCSQSRVAARNLPNG